MTAKPARNEVWLVDLGMAAKVRPCLILSTPVNEQTDRALVSVVPHTTSTGGSRFEVQLSIHFLKTGAFDSQNIITVPTVKLVRRLGVLTDDQMSNVEAAVKEWLGFDPR